MVCGPLFFLGGYESHILDHQEGIDKGRHFIGYFGDDGSFYGKQLNFWNMYLYGASGHAKVIIDILRANDIPIEGLFDDNASLGQLLGYPVFRPSKVKGPLIISIGNNQIRRKIARQLDVVWGMAIHPTAVISEKAEICEGTVVMQGTVIQSCARIGRHCIINTGASVDHECLIGDFVHISPHSTLCGNVQVEEGAWIGAGAVVIPGVKIGKWSVIGAGAVVVTDVPDRVIAVGVPAKIIRSTNMNGDMLS